MKSYLTTFITYISALLLKGNGSLKMDFFVKILWNSSLEELSSKATHCVVHTQSHKFTAFIWKHAKPHVISVKEYVTALKTVFAT